MPKIITVNGQNLSEDSTWVMTAIALSSHKTTDDIRCWLSDIGFGPVAEIDPEWLESEIKHLQKREFLTGDNHFTPLGKNIINELKSDPTF